MAWRVSLGWLAEATEAGLFLRSDTLKVLISRDGQGGLHSSATLEEFDSLLRVEPEDSRSITIDKLKRLGAIYFGVGQTPTISESLLSNYYSFCGQIPSVTRELLRSSTVLVLGLGGTGSEAIQQLLAAGIIRFILVDYDFVSNSNLERQLIYAPSSVGAPKTDAVSIAMKARNPEVQIQTFMTKITNSSDLDTILAHAGSVSFALVCVDEPADSIFKSVSTTLWARRIPFIAAGVMPSSGFWGPLFSAEHESPPPTEFDLWSAAPTNDPPSPSRICFTPYNTIISSFMVAEAWHFLMQFYSAVDFRHRTWINFRKLTLRKISGACHS